MSSRLTIEPAERKKTTLSYEMKLALRMRNNGGCTSSFRVSDSDIGYFQGLRDAGIEDAKLVISMIDKFGECIIDEEF